MLENEILYDDGQHKFFFLGWEEKEEEIVQTNQYLILDGDEGVLLDPGGAHVFPRVMSNVAEITDLSKIRHIFYTHQDPDVTSGILLWLSICEKAKIYISSLWVRFLPHFGIFDQRRIVPIPDSGTRIRLSSGRELEVLPAHFLHSTGNFVLYDPVSKVLFSGDIGAAVFEKGKRYRYVDDFEKHVPLMETFHRRYMSSNIACRRWVEMVSKRPIEIIAPQHGAVFRGETVKKFLEWFRNLKCGVDIIDSFYM
ncbi:MBL fold metallo-hydrolase [Thermotoga sp. KOL6]|uniref:MBL fold metallo-hydrolase n=1 Tax=Thermotoga sp. KOL6 TaxID=126741 RepID=UPI000C783C47|nr:MBL fold metallo-hydrolase [Thermotoga sp. KOL6]PLV58052.1 MBL fold metallo-hydrolase [Thermotoga sp. KOL6]